MYYDDDKLLITFIDTIFKYQNSIIISINYENEFETLFQNENNLLNKGYSLEDIINESKAAGTEEET